MIWPIAVFSQYIFGPLLFLLSLFIIILILLQRGRGGGLTGALGGLGGSSALGVKAGDIFTRITAFTVIAWILVCAIACFWYRPEKLDIEADASASSSIGAADPNSTNNLPPLEPEPVTEQGTDPEKSTDMTAPTEPTNSTPLSLPPSSAVPSTSVPTTEPATPAGTELPPVDSSNPAQPVSSESPASVDTDKPKS